MGHILVLLALTGATAPSSLTLPYRSSLTVASAPVAGFVRLVVPGAVLEARPGLPLLPRQAVTAELPAASVVDSVRFAPFDSSETRLDLPVLPGQPPTVLSAQRAPRWVGPDPAVYATDRSQPDSPVRSVQALAQRGRTLVEVVVCPVRYFPASGRVRLYERSELRLWYHVDAPAPRLASPSAGFDYLILTEAPLDSAFARLADFHTGQGRRAQVRLVSWVCANYPGRDPAEKLRRYLQTLSPDSGLTWVLLGGDVNIVPVRYAYAMTCSSGIGGLPRPEDSLPCDLYYADLDRTWDANRNNVFGELEDSVDLYPEVWVGRAPVRSAAEATAFVTKTLAYAQARASDYLGRALFLGMVLWSDPFTDGGIAKDRIAERWMPAFFQPVDKRYETRGNLDHDATWSALNAGVNLVNHNGHGWTNLWGVGPAGQYFTNADADTLRNGDRQGLACSIGCWTGAFDLDCVGEHLVRNPGGGAVAYIGNSSYGWGAPGNPGFGYSDLVDEEFFARLMAAPATVGAVLAQTKAHFAPFARDRNVWRWHEYDVNLLGDPALTVWTSEPHALALAVPETLGRRASFLPVVVRARGLPASGARVRLEGPDGIAAQGVADAAGFVAFQLPPLDSGSLSVQASRDGWLPAAAVTAVDPVRQALEFRHPLLAGPSLHSAALVEPGAQTRVQGWLVNDDAVPVQDSRLVLASADRALTVLDSCWSVALVPAHDSVPVRSGVRVAFDSTAADGTEAVLTIDVRAAGRRGTMLVPLVAARTRLELADVRVVEPGTARTASLAPNREFWLEVSVRNRGLRPGAQVHARVEDHPDIAWSVRSVIVGAGADETTATGRAVFAGRLGDRPHAGAVLDLALELTTDGASFSDTVRLVVGATGLVSDFESEDGWTTGGVRDLWHRSFRQSHSGRLSYYCGDERDGRYQPGMDCWLLSPPVVVRQGDELRFWRRFSLPIYGSDGMHVALVRSARTDTIDFIGSGGALEPSLVTSGWCEQTYLLGDATGDTVQVRLSFHSDGDGQAEGIYVDDVVVGPTVALDSIPVGQYALGPVTPCPARGPVRCLVAIARPGPIAVDVYSSLGQRVATLLRGPAVPGPVVAGWDRQDDRGRRVPAGTYFIVLTVPGETARTRKVVLLAR